MFIIAAISDLHLVDINFFVYPANFLSQSSNTLWKNMTFSEKLNSCEFSWSSLCLKQETEPDPGSNFDKRPYKQTDISLFWVHSLDFTSRCNAALVWFPPRTSTHFFPGVIRSLVETLSQICPINVVYGLKFFSNDSACSFTWCSFNDCMQWSLHGEIRLSTCTLTWVPKIIWSKIVTFLN